MESIRRVFLLVLSGNAEFEAIRSGTNFGRVEVVRCSIGEVLGVIQMVQYWFTGIPNPSKSSWLE